MMEIYMSHVMHVVFKNVSGNNQSCSAYNNASA